MGCCSVLNCKNQSKTRNLSHGGVSYHRFPKEPHVKEKWIEATGKKEWFPTKTSTICSDHFLESDFLRKNSAYRFLIETAVPSQNLYKLVSTNVTAPRCECDKGAPEPEPTLTTPTKLKRNYSEQDANEPELKKRKIDFDKIDNSPRKAVLRRVINWKDSKIKKQQQKIKKLQGQNRRLRKKISSVKLILKEVEEKFSFQKESVANLEGTNLKVQELMARHVQNKTTGKVSRKEYSPALRSFALTLHYYSPKAYEYVRQTFDTCLPHTRTRTLKKWYSNVGGGPGFTEEAFTALKFKAESSEKPIFAALMLDEMAIRRCVEWDGKKFHGYIDAGTGLEGDHLAEAKEALVFLVTAINANFKVPVGNFFVDGISGEQRAELVKQCIERVHETGVKIVSVTFDGCAANLAMATELGCSIQNNKITFPHPVTKTPLVIILDPCHMVKLLRNAFEAYRTIKDDKNNKIQWLYVELLQKIQENETFHLANKLRAQHIHFQNQRMKVKLATQLFSASVSEAIKFCRTDLQLPVFKDSEATERFLMTINNFFDILNSRNFRQHGFKKPLTENNATQTFEFLNGACEYISKLKTEDDTLMVYSPRKTGFLGFIGCAEALKYLYRSLIQEKLLICLPFYKLSQDHLELLFGNIRAHGGANNNPTARQFMAAYKKLLVHVELKNFGTGNCTELEQLSILNCSSAVTRINKSHRTDTYDQHYEPSGEDTEEEMEEVLTQTQSMSVFSEQVIAYIAGYISRILLKKIRCNQCAAALVTPNPQSIHKFIVAKDKGGLLYPSTDVYRVCKTSEAVIKTMDEKLFDKTSITTKILRHFIETDLFDDLANHQIGEFPSSNHVTDLIKAITERYINVRIHHILKQKTKLTKRQLLTKYIIFQGQ